MLRPKNKAPVKSADLLLRGAAWMKWRVGLILVGLIILAAGYWYRDSLLIKVQQRYFQWQYHQSAYARTTQSQLMTGHFYSAALHQERKYQVYLPAAFTSLSGLTAQYPVIYLLHGYPGVYNDLSQDMPLQEMLDKLIANGQLPPSLVVLVDGVGPTIPDSQYVTATGVDQDMEAYLLEVIGVIDKQYPTRASAQWRAIGGISSGGYGAVNFGLRHPQIADWLFSLSGYFTNKETVFSKLFPVEADRQANEPMRFVSSLTTTPAQHIYLAIGTHDYTEFQTQNHQFFDLLQGLPLQSDLTVYDGVHLWPQWQQALTGTLTKIGTEWKKG